MSSGGLKSPLTAASGRFQLQSLLADLSLRLFLAAKHLSKGIRTSLENFSTYDDIIVYPLYAIGNVIRVENEGRVGLPVKG